MDNKDNLKKESSTESVEEKKKLEDKKEKPSVFKRIGKGIKNVFGMRQTKHGTNTIVAILAMLGILILINFIAIKENVRWDLTKNKKYTLSDQTKKVLENLDEEIDVTLFYQTGNPERENAENLIKEYQEINNKINYQLVDPDKKPTEAKKYGIERYGTTVFEQGDKTEQAVAATETDFTSSILKLSRDEEKHIYFLEGHGEKDIDAMDEINYGLVKTSLEKEGYKVSKLSLLTKPEIPEDASVIVIAGPQKKLLDKESEAIEKYIDNGGKLFLLLDPLSEVKGSTGFSKFLTKWGIHSDRNVVIDSEQYFWTDPSAPVISSWEPHQITDKLPAAFFPGVGEISPADNAPVEFMVTSLAKTSANSWLEKDLNNKQVQFDEGTDVMGPVSIAVAAQEQSQAAEGEEEGKNARLVVVGDSDFASSGFSDALGNQDFFLNSINFLAEDEELISIRPKEEEQRTVALTGRQAQMIFYSTVFGMPAMVIITGILVWVMRRKKRKK